MRTHQLCGNDSVFGVDQQSICIEAKGVGNLKIGCLLGIALERSRADEVARCALFNTLLSPIIRWRDNVCALKVKKAKRPGDLAVDRCKAKVLNRGNCVFFDDGAALADEQSYRANDSNLFIPELN